MSAYVHVQSGTVSSRHDYDAFGRPVWNELEGTGGRQVAASPFGFSTKYTDAETGWCYYGKRYYAPELGRWPNRDPIQERGGLNLYCMVGNDPVNHWDYLGLAAVITAAELTMIKIELRALQSKGIESMKVIDAIDILQHAVSLVDDEIFETEESGRAGGYDWIGNNIHINSMTGASTFIHEAVHAYNDLVNPGIQWYRTDEGMAYAMANLYDKTINLKTMEDAIEKLKKRGDLNNLEAASPWNIFWAKVRNVGTAGAINGADFDLSAQDYNRVKSSLKAHLSCKEIAQILNAKYKGDCVTFSCGTQDEETEDNPSLYYTRVYLREKLPDHFK